MSTTLSFGYDGDRGLGDRLLAAVLRGEKTATSSLAVEYLSGEPLPRLGQQLALMDNAGRCCGIVETVRVRIIPLNLVGHDAAHDEGEGFADASEWRRGHEAFWAEVADLVRAESGDSDWRLRESETRCRALVPSPRVLAAIENGPVAATSHRDCLPRKVTGRPRARPSCNGRSPRS